MAEEETAETGEALRHMYERDRLALQPTFRVLLEQDELLVIDKPQDVCIDGDRPITVEKYVAEQHPRYSKPGLKLRFIHQLDFATSGILCLGFTKKATARLAKCFEGRTTEKHYLAIVHGWPERGKPHRLEWAIADDPADERKFRMCVGSAANPGRASTTVAEVVDHGEFRGMQVAKVLLKLLTGRRHQLRVHCKEWGHPIVGDYTYAQDDPNIPRMMLHAWRLRFPMTLEGVPADEAGGCCFETEDPFRDIIATAAVVPSVSDLPVEAPAAKKAKVTPTPADD
eukprot:GGOE01065291.1.p1 GENE.GGOE01065291.1~~GGOE01065291.1.p1  ORF type:complete len:284 (+),score=96.06 GGOE01065291.1:70-921(+)